MFVLIGYLIVVGSVLGGYLLAGGHMGALFQPRQGSDKPAAEAPPAPGDALTSVAQAMTDAMARATSAFEAAGS